MNDARAHALGFAHRFVPAANAPFTLLLLHGTGGNQDDLIPLGEMIAPGAALLAPRGKVLEQGMPRFFRRLAEGVFDVDDLKARTQELADFVGAATRAYGLDPRRVIAAGYSNGANIAASVLLMRPGTFAGAALLRAMVPFVPEARALLAGTRVLISDGRRDPFVPEGDADHLAQLLRERGADVTLRWQDAGHELTRADVDAVREWIAGFDPARPA
jgi:phospholipase/carboxylesterase